ncbi:hypothetical protein F0521_19270 [Ferrimonas sp. YFM]|nr:hypothetical protein F0521_19270 [Ferrimonas sp. YFM]
MSAFELIRMLLLGSFFVMQFQLSLMYDVMFDSHLNPMIAADNLLVLIVAQCLSLAVIIWHVLRSPG